MAIDSLGSTAAGGARPLDGLDMLESFEAAGLEKLDEQARLDLRRALRHLKKSGILAGGSLAELFGRGKTAAMTRGFVPRSAPAGKRFESCRHTYSDVNEVSGRAAAGSRHGYRAAGIEIRGIDGRHYAGTFARPVKLDEGGYLYRGKVHADLASLERDLVGATGDGMGEMPYALPGRVGGGSSLARFITGGAAAAPTSIELAASIFNRPEGISGGIPAGAGIPGGGATASSILGTGLPMEDKILLLGANLSSSLDSEIEAKMKQIEAAMGGGGAHGGLAGGTGGAAGGSGGGAGIGASGTGGSRQSPNLQLLQTQLQQLIQQRTQMFQMMQNILKTLHDTSMAAIRNMKA